VGSLDPVIVTATHQGDGRYGYGTAGREFITHPDGRVDPADETDGQFPPAPLAVRRHWQETAELPERIEVELGGFRSAAPPPRAEVPHVEPAWTHRRERPSVRVDELAKRAKGGTPPKGPNPC